MPGAIYELTSGKSSLDARRRQQVTETPQLPTTAIYSRSDGVVACQNAQPEGRWQPFERRGWRAAIFPRPNSRRG